MANQKQIKGKGIGGNTDKVSRSNQGEAFWNPAGIKTFLQEVKTEFGKIVWPNKKVTAGLTCFVLLLVMVLSFVLGVFDLFWGWVVTSFLSADWLNLIRAS